jgi:TetR/AcrR family transcriptional regulator, transcriptional repressor for nem operon
MPRDGTATRERILAAAQGLILERGFAGTSVDAVLAAAPASKGAFFHHFASKSDLAQALLKRYAAEEVRMLEQFMTAAEARSDDPAEQLVAFVRDFAQAADELTPAQPGCLFASFIYESQLLREGDEDIISDTVLVWRTRVLERLAAAARVHPPAVPVDLPSLADQVFTTFEGGFILTRAMHDPGALGTQLTHLANYFELLFAPR